MTAAQPKPRRIRIGYMAMMWLISWVATATVWEPARVMLGITACVLVFGGLMLLALIIGFVCAN